ncbi:DUF4003 family protein [Paenibacillus sp. RRE4]|uniref:DUF4003 family protein n=1 Tax=Paenibacillus sp. RRE4 TaxID=2962587 RepID=UPI002881C962|nr:DUF4003 family protein [Paenibacillus sp. RRE4]MDT0125395.1 DUF4003 family protein [Paenibacillus sp. RRE4]
MQPEQMAKAELFVSNTLILKKPFKWQHPIMRRLAALLYVVENKSIDPEAIQQTNDLMKQHTKRFSAFRGPSSFHFAAMLSLTTDQLARLQHTIQVHDLLKEIKFRNSDYLVMAAYQIAAQGQPEQFQHTVKRAKLFYDRMKKEHPFLTGHDDYIFTAMLALSDLELDTAITHMEQLYRELKPHFSAKNSVQTLTQILVIGDGGSEVSERLLALSEAFRSKNHRMDKTYTLPSLALFALLPVEINLLVDQVVETYDWLRTQEGFGAWSINKQELLLFSSALTAIQHVESLQNEILTTSMSTTITNIIIAQQAAMTAAAAAAAATAVSSTQS